MADTVEMDRERAETFLRLLVEAELRDLSPPPLHAGGATDFPFFTVPVTVRRAAGALIAVDALDVPTADAILTDAELALGLRQQGEPTEPGHPPPVGALWLRRLTAPHQRPWRSPVPLSPPPAVVAGRPGRVSLCVPLGVAIVFHDAGDRGELDLLSYARTASGARLVATWRMPRVVPAVDQFAVTDDRGTDYDLGLTVRGPTLSAGHLSLRPDPPDDIRWLDIAAPGEPAVRVHLPSGPPISAGAQVSPTGLSAGEHLLNRIALQLLWMASHRPRDMRLRLPARSPGPLADAAAGLGAMVAALESAGALSPLSPVPGRLAALCASMRIGGHGITAAPARDLPEPWLSALAYYRRRKPDLTAAAAGRGRERFAAVAAALPRVDGVRLDLLGLYHTDGQTWMNVLAIGYQPDDRHGLLHLDVSFPLTVWVRDSAGRWHATRRYAYSADDEYSFTLQLAPPLTRTASWIDVLVAGPSAEACVRLPLEWHPIAGE